MTLEHGSLSRRSGGELREGRAEVGIRREQVRPRGGTPPRGRKPLRLNILGPLTVYQAHRQVDIGPLKQRCLLGLLALQPDRVVTRDEIIDVLWGVNPPRTCAGLVHSYVSRLRRGLQPGREGRARGSVITAVRDGYRMPVEAGQLDLLEFDELVHHAERAAEDAGAALELFDSALHRWRGPVLVDLGSRLRQHPAAIALSQRRLAALLTYTDLSIALGRHEPAVERLRPLVHDEPLHEGLHARLMLALAGCGRQAEALRLFTEIRARLAEELGVGPGAEIQEAHLRVLRGELPLPPVTVSRSTPRDPGAPVPTQLPSDIPGLAGRDRYLAQLDAFLAGADNTGAGTVNAAAIVGAAGVGKTTLAVHWAHRASGRFPDGQLFVNLHGNAPVSASRVLARFLRALGVPADEVPAEADEAAALYRTLLASRKVLVVLDNAAHPAQIRPLLPGSPSCFVVITSRHRLGSLAASDGAHLLDLDVLSPVDSLRALARMLGPDRVRAEPKAAAELARLCAHLPLALSAAAANLVNHPHHRIADYVLALHNGNRLAALEVDSDQHLSLRAAFDHSYGTLDLPTQRLFRRLSLVHGGFSGETVAALIDGTSHDADHMLDRLAAQHLIRAAPAGSYTLDDLLRLYATERAQAEDA
ncbi:BTAD domain-containing putative transcriptional regulator [Crossiella sp. CA198]|uniref:AfsR/SARP family transcriptional regulator n=1 Tax=Crossiella sp. CA198 TaxID=3455607 RepID=UPI003F8D3F50